MEPVDDALKKREMVLLKPYSELSSDDFFVDELLDFTDKEELCENYQEEDAKPLPREGASTNGALIEPSHDFYSSLGELDVQMDELESLEWLSEFVEDSNAEYGILKEEENAIGKPVFKLPVPARARSKRSRARARARARVSPESSSSSGSLCLSYTSPKHGLWAGKPSNAKERRCLHCGVQRTPQWRAGPLGAKTLCNACGVRYKSGRLLPEYRPACSPTFCSELHSNSHRKVLEMRRRNLGIGLYDVGMRL